jgi:hypothetical protein
MLQRVLVEFRYLRNNESLHYVRYIVTRPLVVAVQLGFCQTSGRDGRARVSDSAMEGEVEALSHQD